MFLHVSIRIIWQVFGLNKPINHTRSRSKFRTPTSLSTYFIDFSPHNKFNYKTQTKKYLLHIRYKIQSDFVKNYKTQLQNTPLKTKQNTPPQQID